MPQVAGTETEDSGSVLTSFTGSATTTSQNFSFNEEQNAMTFRNKGTSAVTLTVNGTNNNVPPNAAIEIDDQSFSSFDLITAVGTQQFEARSYAIKTGLPSVKSSLVDTTANKVYVESFKIQTPETNDTGRLQRALDTFANGKGTLVLKYGKTYNVTSLTATGRIKIEGNWANLNSVAPDATSPILKNQGSLILTTNEIYFTGKNVAIENTLFGDSSGVGTRTYIDNCYFQGYTRVSNAIVMRQNDFVKITNSSIYNYDTAIRIESDYTVGERDNTQIFFDNLNLGWCKLGVFMQQCDKSELKGVDIQFCGGLVYLAKDNKRVRFIDCHVEHFGHSSYSGQLGYGYGFYIPSNLSQNDITFENCTALFPESEAIAGFFKGYNDVLWSDATYRNCYGASDVNVPSYRVFNLAGTYKVEGRFSYDDTQVSVYHPSSRWNDSIIDAYGNTRGKSENLLPFSRISSQEQFSTTGTGTLLISADASNVLRDAKKIDITASAQYENYVTVTLKRGWHTLLYNGYNPTGLVYMYVQEHSSPYSERLRAQMRSGSNSQFYRMPFYIPAETTLRIGFWASTNTTFYLNRWEVHEGFVYEYTNDPNIYKLANAPTNGYWLKGERVRNNNITELGTAGSKYVIQEWECIVSGSPGTWLAKRYLTGN